MVVNFILRSRIKVVIIANTYTVISNFSSGLNILLLPPWGNTPQHWRIDLSVFVSYLCCLNEGSTWCFWARWCATNDTRSCWIRPPLGLIWSQSCCRSRPHNSSLCFIRVKFLRDGAQGKAKTWGSQHQSQDWSMMEETGWEGFTLVWMKEDICCGLNGMSKKRCLTWVNRDDSGWADEGKRGGYVANGQTWIHFERTWQH